MPITKSAIKAMRQSVKRRKINLVTIEKYKAAVKAVRQAVTSKKKDEALTALKGAFKELDKAVKKHIIHKNKSARLKSRLTRAIAKVQ